MRGIIGDKLLPAAIFAVKYRAGNNKRNVEVM